MFGCYCLELYYFLMKKRKGGYPVGRGGGAEIERVEGGETIIRIIVWHAILGVYDLFEITTKGLFRVSEED